MRALDERFYGLSTVQCEDKAWRYDDANCVDAPTSWRENESAGKDWLTSFMKRHGLAIRKSKATSIARQTAFNHPVVMDFFNRSGRTL